MALKCEPDVSKVPNGEHVFRVDKCSITYSRGTARMLCECVVALGDNRGGRMKHDPPIEGEWAKIGAGFGWALGLSELETDDEARLSAQVVGCHFVGTVRPQKSDERYSEMGFTRRLNATELEQLARAGTPPARNVDSAPPARRSEPPPLDDDENW